MVLTTPSEPWLEIVNLFVAAGASRADVDVRTFGPSDARLIYHADIEVAVGGAGDCYLAVGSDIQTELAVDVPKNLERITRIIQLVLTKGHIVIRRPRTSIVCFGYDRVPERYVDEAAAAEVVVRRAPYPNSEIDLEPLIVGDA